MIREILQQRLEEPKITDQSGIQLALLYLTPNQELYLRLLNENFGKVLPINQLYSFVTGLSHPVSQTLPVPAAIKDLKKRLQSQNAFNNYMIYALRGSFSYVLHYLHSPGTTLTLHNNVITDELPPLPIIEQALSQVEVRKLKNSYVIIPFLTPTDRTVLLSLNRDPGSQFSRDQIFRDLHPKLPPNYHLEYNDINDVNVELHGLRKRL